MPATTHGSPRPPADPLAAAAAARSRSLAFASISCRMSRSTALSLAPLLLPPAWWPLSWSRPDPDAAPLPPFARELGPAPPSSSSSPNTGTAAAAAGLGARGLGGSMAPAPLGPAAPSPALAAPGASDSTSGPSSSRLTSSVAATTSSSLPASRAILRARSSCALISARCRSSSSFSAAVRFSRFSSSMSCMGSLWMRVIHQPFSVSSTLHLPSRPRYLTNSVSVSQRVEFMCTWCLSLMYSLYTFLASTREKGCARLRWSRNACSNSSL
mmetsp:Transcript_14821/g.36993  ORF Transcript_14821/g.36993 Transcript_14821/m.36993 type:complete len:270 (-) Transcript_14821:270-1079(-)